MEKAHNRRGYLVEAASKWMQEHGYRPGEQPTDPESAPRFDVVFRKAGGAPVHLQAKVADAYRSAVFPALIGDAILHIQHDRAPGQVMLAFLLNKFSGQAIADLERYAGKYLPDLSWFVIDSSGHGQVRIGGLSADLHLPPLSSQAVRAGPFAPASGLFSANNQWMLKILLLAGMPGRYWGGPSRVPSGVVELAKAAGVSQPSASAFVAKFEAAGYLRRAERRLAIVHHRDLLDDWFHALKLSRRGAISLRGLYGDEPEDRVLEKLRALCSRSSPAAEVPAIVGGHLACHLLGAGRSNVRAIRIYANRPMEEVMAALNLVPGESGPASIGIVPPPAGKAVAAGSVRVNGLPVCDLLQCYLDVRASHARGVEQSEFIRDRILMPHFERVS